MLSHLLTAEFISLSRITYFLYIGSASLVKFLPRYSNVIAVVKGALLQLYFPNAYFSGKGKLVIFAYQRPPGSSPNSPVHSNNYFG